MISILSSCQPTKKRSQHERPSESKRVVGKKKGNLFLIEHVTRLLAARIQMTMSQTPRKREREREVMGESTWCFFEQVWRLTKGQHIQHRRLVCHSLWPAKNLFLIYARAIRWCQLESLVFSSVEFNRWTFEKSQRRRFRFIAKK